MNNTEKLFYQIALTQIEGVGDVLARSLLDAIGDVESVFRSSQKQLISIKGISNNLASEILNPRVLQKAEKELEFIHKNKIQTFFYSDADYPSKLKECVDAPILLYHKGNTNLNSKKIISIVGTRKSTDYGNKFCHQFIEELSTMFPDILIVSGLAYGIDIQSHQAALKSHLSTVGVLAHGLDRIYPSSHRKTAIEMLEKGGLLTEFISGTEPDKFNFVRRNRIVAGLSDAVIVVQSDKKGGSLITADLANSYNREVFALPGRITDKESIGCNYLIESNKAILLQSVESFAHFMQWDIINLKEKTKQIELFLDLNIDEQAVYDLLVNYDSLHINVLASTLNQPTSVLMITLINMELKNVLKSLPGGFYVLNK